MANLQIKDPPVFTEQVHQIEEEEYLTAELENEIKGALLNNEVFLKVLAETIQKTVEAHTGNGTIHVTAKDKEIWSNKDGGNADMVDGYHAAHFAAADHGHDGRYYTETEVNSLLNGKAAASHTHDARYYTETEVDTLLNGKAASNHKHIGLEGWGDTRNTPTTPNDYNGTLKCVGIKTATGLGSSLDGSGFATVFGCRGWHDSSGGYSHEFAFTGNGNVYHRSGASTTWEKPWEKILVSNDSCNKNWYWSGQEGQPSWLWGGNDGINMYVYNPSNFRVNYANSAGSASSASKLTANAGSSMRPVYFSNGVPVATTARGVAIQSSTPSDTAVLWAW